MINIVNDVQRVAVLKTANSGRVWFNVDIVLGGIIEDWIDASRVLTRARMLRSIDVNYKLVQIKNKPILVNRKMMVALITFFCEIDKRDANNYVNKFKMANFDPDRKKKTKQKLKAQLGVRKLEQSDSFMTVEDIVVSKIKEITVVPTKRVGFNIKKKVNS